MRALTDAQARNAATMSEHLDIQMQDAQVQPVPSVLSRSFCLQVLGCERLCRFCFQT